MNDDVAKSQELIARLRRANLNRRQMLYRAGVLGVSAAALGPRLAFAQGTDSSGGQKSITREEYKQQLREKFPIPEDAPKGGTFIYGESTDIGTTNLMLGSDDPTNPIMGFVQETLVNSSPVDASYVPGLADSWEISADGLTYTYHLNQTAKWHDGEPFTAE